MEDGEKKGEEIDTKKRKKENKSHTEWMKACCVVLCVIYNKTSRHPRHRYNVCTYMYMYAWVPEAYAPLAIIVPICVYKERKIDLGMG